jgi:hypothetical protein
MGHRLMGLVDSQVGDIMDAIATALEDLPQIEQSVGRMNLNPTPPCIDVYPGDPFDSMDEAGFKPSGAYFFTVRARVDTADHEAGQDVLIAWMDRRNTSGIAALLHGQDIDGTGSVEVQQTTGFRRYADTADVLLGFECRLRVIPSDN